MKKVDKWTKRWLIVLIVFLVAFLVTDLILCRLSGFRKSDFTNPAFPVAYTRTRERVSGRNGRKNNLESLTINEEIS